MAHQLKRANDEIKLYVSNKTEDKKKSFREQLLKQIADQVSILQMIFSEWSFLLSLQTTVYDGCSQFASQLLFLEI